MAFAHGKIERAARRQRDNRHTVPEGRSSRKSKRITSCMRMGTSPRLPTTIRIGSSRVRDHNHTLARDLRR
jgi:hypothetical protein